MARLDKTIKDYQEHLTEKGIKNIPEFIQSIIDADITKGKYSRFLLDCYLNDKFREEDLQGGLESTIGTTISLFHKHKSKLPEEQRSIYQYNSPGSLWSAVKQFDGELSGKEIKREEKEKIYAETEFVYEDEITGFKIISPLTMESAKWWGKGTRWCTSAENNNQFKNYAEQAPLLIVIMPSGDKLQLCKTEESKDFMDEADNEVTLEYVEKNIDLLEPIVLWLGDLKYIPEKILTYDVCKKLLHNDEIVNNLPDDYRTEEMCRLAMQHNGENLYCFPHKYRTEEICRLALQNNGDALISVPDELKTKEFFELAVKSNGNSLFHIPKELKTEELCKLAVQQNGISLYHVPEEFKTEEICKIAVNNNGKALSGVPKEFYTKELCLEIVKNDKSAIPCVPHNMYTKELCLLIIQCDKCNSQNELEHSHFAFIPENMKTEEMCRLAVQSNGMALEYVPEEYITQELCEIAAQSNGMVLPFIPEHMKTEKIYQLAIAQNSLSLLFVEDSQEDEMKKYVKYKPVIIPEEKYQQTFSEIRSFFPEKSLSLKM